MVHVYVYSVYCFSVAFVIYEARKLHSQLQTTDNVYEAEKEYQYIYPKTKTKVKQEKDGE